MFINIQFWFHLQGADLDLFDFRGNWGIKALEIEYSLLTFFELSIW